METRHSPITGLVLHFRTPDKTISCLRSQQFEGVQSAVIVDNSEDGGHSLGLMRRELDALRASGFDIDILSPGRNLGFAAGVNYGLAQLVTRQPTHVLLINSDARLTPGALAHMRLALNSAPIVAPRIAQGNQPPSSPFAYYDRLFGFITPTAKAMPIRYASGCCLLVRRDEVRSPLFDQDFFFYGEDVMLSFSCGRRSCLELECADAIVAHATSSSAKNGSMFYEYHMNRSHWLLAKKLARNPLELCIFVAARCLTLPLRAIVRSIRFRSLVACKGLAVASTDVVRGQCRSFTPPPRS